MEVLRVPMINANERELEISEVLVEEGQQVHAGQLLCIVESTKAAVDVEAPNAGFVRKLQISEGQRMAVGALICLLTPGADDPIELPEEANAQSGEGPRVTRKAQALADAHGLDLSTLGLEGIIKTTHVQAALDRLEQGAAAAVQLSLPPTGAADRVVLWGSGGHGRAVVDLIRSGRPDLDIVAAVDDSKTPASDVLGVPVEGSSEDLAAYHQAGVRYAALGIGAVTNNALRAELFARLEAHGFGLPSWVHKTCAMEPSARMGRGCQLFPGSVVGSAVTLGDNVIVNSGVVVSHDCVIGDHTHLTPGAILAGNVKVGRNCVIGMGVTIYLGITIGDNVVISNGCHIMRDVPSDTVVRLHQDLSF